MHCGRFGGRILALLSLVTLAGGCASDKAVISQAQDEHSSLEPAILNDASIQAYMDKLGQRIVASAKELDAQGVGPKSHKNGENNSWMFEDVQFHMVGSPTLNAFTTGGHHVYIYSSLFTTAKTEDEFAAVCSHEFAHIYCRHVQAGMNRQYGIYGAAAAAAIGGAAAGVALDSDNKTTGALTGGAAGGAAGLAAGQFLGMGFTRKDEDQADQFGFQFYTHAGWDPNHFADFFQQMIAKGYDTTPEMMSDHPKLADRVKNTQRRIEELQKSDPNYASWRKPDITTPSEFASLQSRAAKLQKAMPQGKDTKAAELMLAAFPSCVAPTDAPEQTKARNAISRAAKKQQQ